MKGRVESRNEFADILQAVRPNGQSTAEQKRVAADQQHRAALTVARYARTLERPERRLVCRELLEILGLLPGAESPPGDAATIP